MKTITMDFDEYEKIDGERKKASEALAEYKHAIKVCYGDEIAGSILSRADEIEESKRRTMIVRAVHEGKF